MPERLISVRLDAAAERALRDLTDDGTPQSQAIRAALRAAAETHRRFRLRAEAEALAADEDDRREAAAVRALMDELRGTR